MENLHEMSNQIDSIKEKLTDKEYKDLMELSKKIYDTKDKKYIKCLMIKCKMLRCISDDDAMDDNGIEYIDKFEYTLFERDGRLDIHIRKQMEVVEKIYEITNEHPGMMVMEENKMNKEAYENLKENKYQNNDDDYVLVYLCDM
tara:strand:+ start:405 stop:836 length:432 start_codon:yes stop_codon:yes gene_type:complete